MTNYHIISTIAFFYVVNIVSTINVKPVDKWDSDDNLVVTTDYGQVRGFYVNNTRVFWGIPYAKPPTGDLRWKEPAPPSPWATEILDSTRPPKACIQPFSKDDDEEQDEDCLYLNIYTPAEEITGKLPVIVIYHGGSFEHNSIMNGKTDGRFLAAQGAVVVNPNFRLGALGFLVTKSKSINGNYGIMDQRLALEFVQENIESFGGDPDRVTIMGPSSGAQSVAIHLTTKKSSGLFSQAILLDDPFTLSYHKVNSKESQSIGSIFAKYLNCSSGDISCMKELSSDDIRSAQISTNSEVNSQIDFSNLINYSEIWIPVIDGIHVDANPLQAILEKPLNKRIIIGSNKDDSRNILAAFGNASLSMEYYLKIQLLIFKEDAAKVVAMYPPRPLLDNSDQFARAATHYMVTCPNRLFARNAGNGQAVFHYIYSAPTPAGVFPNILPICVNYACHDAATTQEFGTFSLTGISPPDNMKASSDTMLCYWLNFAHTGNPHNNTWSNDECLNSYTQWPMYDSKSGWKSMDFRESSNEIVENYNKKYCDFWDSIGYIKEAKDIKTTKCRSRGPETL